MKMAATLVKSFSKLCIHSQKVPQLLVPQRIKLNSSFQQYSVFRNPATLLNKGETVLAAKISPTPVSQSFFHTTPVFGTTYERKLWREPRVINRFYRLHWGGWIRCFGGRNKGLYKKTARQRWKLKQHVFCNRKQCKLLDTLVTEHWRQPKYFVDTPYDPYQKRTNSYHFPTHAKFYP